MTFIIWIVYLRVRRYIVEWYMYAKCWSFSQYWPRQYDTAYPRRRHRPPTWERWPRLLHSCTLCNTALKTGVLWLVCATFYLPFIF